MPEQLTRKQVELVLRRATELEQRDDNALDTLSPQDLERVAEEMGMSRDALHQALAESRAGALMDDEERTLVDRLFGPRIIDARRFVPGDVTSVRLVVDKFLAEQGFTMKRNLGPAQVWEPGQDWRARMRRALKGGAYRLPRNIEIDVRVADVPGGAHPVLVVLRIDAGHARTARVGAATASLVVATVAIGAGALLLPMPTELLALGGGGIAGLGGSWLSRATYRDERAKLTTAVERFLDFLEHDAPAPRRAQDVVHRIVDFLAGEWWR